MLRRFIVNGGTLILYADARWLKSYNVWCLLDISEESREMWSLASLSKLVLYDDQQTVVKFWLSFMIENENFAIWCSVSFNFLAKDLIKPSRTIASAISSDLWFLIKLSKYVNEIPFALIAP